MKKLLSIIAAIMLLEFFSPQAWGQTIYSTIAPSGQTIYYQLRPEGIILITSPNGTGWEGFTKPTGSLVFPDSITHGGVKYLVAINRNAFSGCNGLTSVTIQNYISIWDSAFSGCSGLTTVNFNADQCSGPRCGSAFQGCSNLGTLNIGNNVKFFPCNLFNNCSSLTTINFNADSCIWSDAPAFQGCTNLVTLNIGNNVKAIPRYAFSGCTGLTSVTIPNSVTSIMGNAFSGCTGLISVTIPNSVTSIEGSAFSGCTGLTTVNFNADSCTLMGRQNDPAFQGCTNLVTLNIGNNVKTVPSYAFSRCSHLSEIHSPSRVAPPLGSAAFDGVPSTIPVHIPCGSSASYYSRWSYFSNFVEEAGFTFTATSDNEQQGTVQILTMPTCTSPQAVLYATANSGYHFDHWSDGSTSNPYSLTVTDDLDLIGYFVADGTEGISDIYADGLRIYSENGRIAIEGAEGEAVAIYDMMGRLISGMWIVEGGKQELAVPTGVYLVRIGDKTARKVVVL